MRPYLAVLKDSLREALASRVLWIAVILTTLVLLLAAPLGIKEEKSARLQRNSVRNWSALVVKIDEQRRATEPAPGRQIWDRLSPPLQGALAKSLEETPGAISSELIPDLVAELNFMLHDPTLYDAAAWEGADIGEEAGELLRRGVRRLDDDELARLNRLLLRAAYPDEVLRAEGSDVYISYLIFKPIGPLPLTRAQLTPVIKYGLALIVDYGVGVFAVFAAILVTASIIPQTFEPGAIDLLLSKPVSRTLLFLTKFLGGCTFVTLNAAYFITGLWLIAGARFGIWSHGLFLCLPVILFLFAVYYSVSALTGVLWRNAIVSVALSIAFWMVCFGMWFMKSYAESQWIDAQRYVKLVPAGESLLSVDERGRVHDWRSRDSTWEDVFVNESPPAGPAGLQPPDSMIGPVYDQRRERLMAIQMPPFAGGMSLFGPAPTLAVGKRADGWARTKGPAPPAGTLALLASPRGEIIVVNRGVVYQLAGDPGKGVKSKSGGEKFVRAGPDPALRLDSSAVVVMDPETGNIAALSHGVATILNVDAGGNYVRAIEKEVAAVQDAPAVAALGGKTLLVALADGSVLIFDAATLELRDTIRPEGATAPRFVAAAPGGRWFSVLFHNHKLRLYDARQARMVGLSLTGQGNISAAAFVGPDRLLAVDRGNRVTEYRLDPFSIEARRVQALNNMEVTYYYGLVPLYTLFPKPGELGKAIAYLLKDKDEIGRDRRPPDLSRQQDIVDVASPVWSSMAFLAVMLTLSCLYVRRTDF
jgi:hypothetical protein